MSVSRRCLCCVKYLMFVFNLIFWVSIFTNQSQARRMWLIRRRGLAFLQTGRVFLPSLSFPSLSAANVLLVAGGITMVTGFLGCLGALKEQRCLLFTFFVILVILILTEITLVLILYYLHDQVELHAKGDLKDGMKKYYSEPELQKSWDNVQKMFKCCGVNNKTDWYEVLNGTLPLSCCIGAEKETCKVWNEQGCYERAKTLLGKHIHPIPVGVCIGIVQILALVFSMQMYCQILHAEKNLD